MQNTRSNYYILTITVLLLAFALSACTMAGTSGVRLNPTTMRSDLEFLINTILATHPATAQQPTAELQAAINAARQRLSAEEPRQSDFEWSIASVLNSLGDRQTSLTDKQQDEWIDLPLFRCADGLYVVRDSGSLRAGDRLVSIGGQNPLDYKIQRYLPAFSPNLERAGGTALGELFSRKSVLSELGLIGDDGNVEVQVQRAGKGMTAKLAFSKVQSSTTVTTDPPDIARWDLELEHSLGYFRVDRLVFGTEANHQLDIFVTTVKAQGIKNVVLDLRYNSGGDWSAAQEFLRYLNVTSYQDYGQATRINDSSELSISQPQNISNDRYRNNSFPGKLYVLVSNTTGNEACRLAMLLRQNGLAELVGLPLGDAPAHYGVARSFVLPASGKRFTVSTVRFLPPGKTAVDDDYIPNRSEVRLQDVINGADVEMRMVRVMAKWRERIYEQPAPPRLASLQDNTPEQSARAWLESTLTDLMAAKISPRYQLAEYAIHQVRPETAKYEGHVVVWVQYSIKPAYPDFYQAAGNGDQDGDWFRNKETYLIFWPEGRLFRVEQATGI